MLQRRRSSHYWRRVGVFIRRRGSIPLLKRKVISTRTRFVKPSCHFNWKFMFYFYASSNRSPTYRSAARSTLFHSTICKQVPGVAINHNASSGSARPPILVQSEYNFKCSPFNRWRILFIHQARCRTAVDMYRTRHFALFCNCQPRFVKVTDCDAI